MKKIIYSAMLLGMSMGTVTAQKADTRTVETRIADLLAQTPAENAKLLKTNAEEIAALGKDGLVQLILRLSAPENAQNGALEFAIGGFTYYVNQPSAEAWRKLAAEAYAEALPRLSNKVNKAFLLTQIQHLDKGEGISAMVKLLDDSELVGPAARALVKTGKPEAANALLKALGSANGASRLSLIEALGDMRFADAAPTLEKYVTSTDGLERKVAQYALSLIGATSSQPVLAAAAEKSGFIYDESNATGNYLQYLALMANKGESALVEKAAQSLLTKAVGAKQTHTRSAALSLLSQVQGEKAIPTLTKAAESTNSEYRGAALSNLTRFAGPAVATALTKSLAKSTPAGKADIISFLGNSGASNVLSALYPSLLDKNAAVKVAAIGAVAKLGGENSIANLLPLLKTGDTKVVGAVSSALLSMKGSSVVDKIAAGIPALPDAAKAALVNVLASRGATSQLGVVSSLLGSKNAAVQTAAFSALKSMTSSNDLPQLFSLLNTTKDANNLKAVQEAVKSVVKTGGTAQSQSGLLLDQLNKTSNKASFLPVLAGVGGTQALKAVVSSFNDGDDAVKKSAVVALSDWTDNSSLAELLKIAQTSNNSDIQNEAIAGYVKTVSRSKDNAVQKTLQLRSILEVAKSNDQKVAILNELQKNKTFGALIVAGKYLEVPALQQAAANAVMNIGLSSTDINGPEVKKLLNKTIDVLQGQDAGYQKEAIRKHLSALNDTEGYVSIFNGKDLTGWKGLVENPIKRQAMSKDSLAIKQKIADEKMRNGWKVENGVLVFTGKGDNIVAEKEYGDIEMYIDWKLDTEGKDGDAGIYLRGTPQVQIWDTSRVKVGAQVGSGGLYNNMVHPKNPTKVADNQLGEWNTFYVKMIGDRVTVDLNGERVVDNVILENFWDRKSPIFPVEQLELQAHGTKVFYRDIYVKELPRVQPFELSESEAKEGFKVLFDGTNMHEWIGNTEDYFIENGNMVIEQRGKGRGNLYTKKEYSDFVYRFEFQLTPGANNGLGIRAPLEGDAAYVGAAELQILDDTAPIYKDLKPYQYHGSVYGIIAPKRGHLKPVGEWNYQEVMVQGSRVKITLNGTVIVDGDLVEATKNGIPDGKEHPGLHRKSGHIGFLGHGTVVRFRNIRIKELPEQKKEEPVAEPSKKDKKKNKKKK